MKYHYFNRSVPLLFNLLFLSAGGARELRRWRIQGRERLERERETMMHGDGDVEKVGVTGSLFCFMLPGFDREQEMSVMVSALAHVVAGDEAAVGGGGGGSSSSACKIGREEQDSRMGHFPSYAMGGASNSSGTSISNVVRLLQFERYRFHKLCIKIIETYQVEREVICAL